jgi:hypothetical protein
MPALTEALPQEHAIRLRHRRIVRWLLLAAVLIGLLSGHRPLLRLAACTFIAEDSDAEAAWLVPLSGDSVDEHVARRWRAMPGTQVLLFERAPDRLVSVGVLRPWADAHRSTLLARGVAAPAVEVLPEETRSDWDCARGLRGWLEAHPGSDVALLCDRFGSRRLRVILDRVLGPVAPRARIVALPDRRYDETNWWRTKEGVVGCWEALAGLCFTWLAGEGERPAPLRDPDAYEQALR